MKKKVIIFRESEHLGGYFSGNHQITTVIFQVIFHGYCSFQNC